MSYFTDLGLAEPLIRALETKGYTDPTPIQTQAIPALLAGRDLLLDVREQAGDVVAQDEQVAALAPRNGEGVQREARAAEMRDAVLLERFRRTRRGGYIDDDNRAVDVEYIQFYGDKIIDTIVAIAAFEAALPRPFARVLAYGTSDVGTF